MGDNQQAITAEQVQSYLAEHSDFFLMHPDVIESLQLNGAPEGTVSFVQKQTNRLQDKNQKLQQQLHALIDNARQNTDLHSRINQLSLRLIDAVSFEAFLALLMNDLKQEFKADNIALHLFSTDQFSFNLPEPDHNISLHHDSDLQAFKAILSKQQIVCGRLSKAQKTAFFADKADKIKSVACLALGDKPCLGLLAIASADEDRFHADMGTEYLHFLSDIIAIALRRSYAQSV